MKLQIYVTYRIDKPAYLLPSNDVYIPFCAATTSSEGLWDTSLKIAEKNSDNLAELCDQYCELATQYWAWKNGANDYVGFCHYRRFFSFADDPSAIGLDNFNFLSSEKLDEKSIEKNNILNIPMIRDEVSKFDLILPLPSDLKKSGFQSVEEQYIKGSVHLKGEDIDLVKKIIKEKFPQYVADAEEYFSGTESLYCNMFIMRKELFEEYSQFLFSILEQFRKERELTNYSIEGQRVLGHLGERLLGVFWCHCRKKGIKISYRPIILFKDTSPDRVNFPLPFKTKNNLPIVFCCSEAFLPFCSVVINSIKANASSRLNYDIFILHRGISKPKQKQTIENFRSESNFSIRFIEAPNIQKIYSLNEENDIKLDTYLRFYIPSFFRNYERVLYLDCDLIVNDDLEFFLQLDMEDSLVAAAVDIAEVGNIYGNQKEARQYAENVLRLTNLNSYFNNGVLLFNVAKFNSEFPSNYLLEFAEACKLRYQDQDVMNILCEGRVKLLDQKWNWNADPKYNHIHWLASFAPAYLAKDYFESENEPKIIHFAGPHKPWKDITVSNSDYFWRYATNNNFYHEILFTAISNCVGKNSDALVTKTSSQNVPLPHNLNNSDTCNNTQVSFWDQNKKRLSVKIFAYWILSKICFDPRRQKYAYLKNLNFAKLKELI